MKNPQYKSKALSTFLILVLIACLSACKSPTNREAVNAFNGVIPKPSKSETADGVFRIEGGTEVTAVQPELDKLATELTRIIGSKTGIIVTKGLGGSIVLSLDGDSTLGKEGYRLTVKHNEVMISATSEAGIFYGIQTFRQLLSETTGSWLLNAGTIEDRPKYEWRGAMLDVARHFFSVEDVKRYIDLMSFYKLNVVHLGLTNDQGWRIEIKSWPKLADIGGKTQVGGGGGGFYTQEQYKDIVEYAAARYVTIVPEIDMPGHINAALASYPELYCKGLGKAGELYEGTEVGFSTLCLKNPLTEKFVTEVIHELALMTPGKYLHIGGDEAQVTPKDDYIAFVNMFRKIVEAEGKIMVGWEEIAQGDVDGGVIAQHWHSAEHAKTAVAKGAKVLLSPSTKVYLDMKYDTATERGYDWAALIEVDDAYNWNPDSLVAGLDRNGIIGVEAPIWGETLRDFKDAEFLLFPRTPGIAEVAWSTGERKWDEYRVRLGRHGKTMDELGINYYKSPKVDWAAADPAASRQ